jgi:citrate lyase synthetase
MASENGYLVYRPTLAERFWRWVGFRYVHAEMPAEADALPHWLVVETGFHFSFGDRLRLLLGGKLRIRTTTNTQHEAGQAISVSSFTFVPPWGRGSK